MERFDDRGDRQPPAPNGKKRNQKNTPRFDVQSHLYRMTGADLTRIYGVDAYTALKVISEVGTDITKWTSGKHFASWLVLSPNNRITGGRVISSSHGAVRPLAARPRATATRLPRFARNDIGVTQLKSQTRRSCEGRNPLTLR